MTKRLAAHAFCAWICVSGGLVWLGCSGGVANPGALPGDVDGSTGNDGGTPNDGGGTNDTGAPGTQDAARESSVNAPEVSLAWGSCPSFTPCDTDPKGNWTITGGCISEETLKPLKDRCATAEAKNVVITARGLLEIDGTNLKRTIETTLSGTLDIPQSCVIGGCTTVAGLLKFPPPTGPGFDDVTCADAAGGGCTCTVSDIALRETQGTYTKTGSSITLSTNESFDFCVQGNALEYRETTQNVPLVGTIKLAK